MHKSERICTDRQNYNAVDLAKFICSILVVIIHVTPFAGAAPGSAMAQMNYLIKHCLAKTAVPFFFVMSGFFLYRKTQLSDFDGVAVREYIHRMLRLYVAWTVIYFPIALCGFFRDEKGIASAAVHYIRDFFFVGYGQLWYLLALIVAVVMVSFLLQKNVKPEKILLLGGILYICGLFAQSWFGLIVPLRERMPVLWFALKQLKKVMVTSRNGVFEGFLFVAMGMYLAYFGTRLTAPKALAGFLVALALMSLEQTILCAMQFTREEAMFLFLVPAVFFLCAFVLQVQLPDHPVYRKLRTLSTLIFFLHMWVKEIVFALLKLLWAPLIDTWLPFALTLLLSILVSEIIIVVSQRPKCAWVKRLYC